MWLEIMVWPEISVRNFYSFLTFEEKLSVLMDKPFTISWSIMYVFMELAEIP